MEFADFGKHAPYIGWSFGITFAVLLLNVFIARHAHRKMLRMIKRTQEER